MTKSECDIIRWQKSPERQPKIQNKPKFATQNKINIKKNKNK